MKKFIFSLFSFVLLTVGLMIFVTFVIRDDMKELTYMAGIRGKATRIRNLPGARIIFVGGSNLSYGLDSTMIANAFGRPVINMGIHAGLGLRYHLDTALPFLHKGDVLVVVPEYGQFKDLTFCGDAEVWEAAEFVPEDMRLLSIGHFVSLLKYFPGHACRKTFRLIKFWRKASYRRHAFHWKWNAEGDMTGHWDESVPKWFDKGVPKVQTLNGDVFRYLKDFSEKVRDAGALFLIMPACLDAECYAAQIEFVEDIANELKNRGIPYCAHPERYKMDCRFMYDTPYHLNGVGVKVRTEKVIEDLKTVL